MAKNLIVTTTVERWNDLVSLDQRFLKKFVFRGQADSSWQLATSLERMVRLHTPNYIDRHLPTIYEHDMLVDFKWKYPLYEKLIVPSLEDNVEWLSLMQHYGAPTRLLDFTKSIFVALYMALDNSFMDSSCIWGLNTAFIDGPAVKLCVSEQGKASGVVTGSELKAFARSKANSYIDHYFSNTPKELYLIHPTLCNDRLSIQQGLFIMPSDITVPFMDILNEVLSMANPNTENVEVPIENFINYSYSDIGKTSQRDILLFKINIPKRFKYQLTKLLIQMNITAETLYPGLSGMAKSLSYLRHSMHEYEE